MIIESPFSKKYRIGYTSGVYDLFHIGHLNILKKAKELCNYLIVGVSLDELVVKYKHKKPIVPFLERAAIISSIHYVDEVVAQEELDKIYAWNKYKYDALFGGSDWMHNPSVVEAEAELKLKGVDIVLFPYTQTTSSTILTQAINKLQEDA